MKVIELVIRKAGRVVAREASLVENEGKTLTEQYATRTDELQALGFEVERIELDDWPTWR